MRSEFGAFAFDFDGVLVESVDIKTEAFATLYRPYGETVTREVIAYHLKHGGISRTEKFRYFHRALLDLDLDHKQLAMLEARFSRSVEEAVIAAPWTLGARELLESGLLTMPLFVVSGTPESELKRIIRRRNMEQYFSAVFGSPATKDAILSSIAESLELSPKRLLMVGDSTTDLAGAVTAGTAFIGFVSEGLQNQFPSEVEVISDLRDLIERV